MNSPYEYSAVRCGILMNRIQELCPQSKFIDLLELAQRVRKFADHGYSQERWESMCEIAGVHGRAIEDKETCRLILMLTLSGTLSGLETLAVVPEVKGRLLEQFEFVCEASGDDQPHLDAQHYGFRVMCKYVTFSRFPAGQLDWEVSGFSRRWILKVPMSHRLNLLRYLYLEIGGHWPMFETHLALRRDAPILLEDLERESFQLMARSMALQPGIRGYVASSWFLDPLLGDVSPHLRWLTEWYREWTRFGAILTNIGPAAPDSGFLVGDRKRRRAYESGMWQPLAGLALWSRKDIARWLKSAQTG